MNDNPPVPSAEDGHQPPQGVFDGETGAVRDAVEEDNHKLRREMETLREHMTRQVKVIKTYQLRFPKEALQVSPAAPQQRAHRTQAGAPDH